MLTSKRIANNRHEFYQPLSPHDILLHRFPLRWRSSQLYPWHPATKSPECKHAHTQALCIHTHFIDLCQPRMTSANRAIEHPQRRRLVPLHLCPGRALAGPSRTPEASSQIRYTIVTISTLCFALAWVCRYGSGDSTVLPAVSIWEMWESWVVDNVMHLGLKIGRIFLRWWAQVTVSQLQWIERRFQSPG